MTVLIIILFSPSYNDWSYLSPFSESSTGLTTGFIKDIILLFHSSRDKVMPNSSMSTVVSVLVVLLLCCSSSVNAFISPRCSSQPAFGTYISAGSSDNDPNEIVAKRIIVEGDVQGGYYRSCVRNEAGRFRRLSGTMTPPDDSKKAEIYVEVRSGYSNANCFNPMNDWKNGRVF